MPKEKAHMNLVIIGHIDNGKSTLMGHLLIKTGAVCGERMAKLNELIRLWDNSKKMSDLK